MLFLLAALMTGCRDRGDATTPGTSGGDAPAAADTPSPAVTGPGASSPAAAAVVAGVSAGTLRAGAADRTYRLFIPSAATRAGAALPLVVALHGGLGTPEQFAGASRFEALAEREGFIVVFPAGVERTWNGGACCRPAAALRVDDVGFLAALIEKLEATLPIDRSRVLMTGHSNGAIMSFRFACERPGLVSAVVPVAGSLEIEKCEPSVAVPLLDIHGDADRNHPLEGGEGDRSIANVAFRSTSETMARWAAAMACQRDTATRTEGALTTTAWSGCREHVRTELLVIAGADHPWPGSEPRGGALQGEPSRALDATAAAYQFLIDVTK